MLKNLQVIKAILSASYLRYSTMTSVKALPSYICAMYAIGATRAGEVVFWQIDIEGKVRTGKVMKYNPITGHRIKHESGSINWIHNLLKKDGTLPGDFNLVQCFFGEHLLRENPTKSVAIVESEKSAIIGAGVMPDLVWLAAGNLNGLSIDKCKVLKGRNVILFPDLKAFDKWSEKANEIKTIVGCKISVSDLLEQIATDEERENGFDIADYLIREIKEPAQIRQRFSNEIESLINQNEAMLYLIETFDLEAV
jgi:hypothetical protein